MQLYNAVWEEANQYTEKMPVDPPRGCHLLLPKMEG